MSDIEGGGEDQSYADCSVDGDDSPRYPSPSAESMDSCSLDSSDQEETDPAGEPTPAARPESPPPVAINLVSDDEERGEDDGGDEAPQEPPVAALSPKRASHAPRLTDLPPANPKQRPRKKTASQQPPPVAISAVVSDDDGDEQLQPGGGAEEAPRQPPVAALSPKRAAYHALRLTDLPPKLKRSREKTARHHGQHVLAARRPQLAPPVTTGIPHAHDDQQHGDDRVEETLPQPPKRVAHHVPPLTDFPPHLQRFPKAATSHHGQPMPAARLEIPPPVTTSTADREEKPGHDRAEETPQQVPVAPLPPKRSAYALRLTDLPPDLQWFMQETKSFFTRPHALERHGQMLAASTFDKALERILCEYGGSAFYIIC